MPETARMLKRRFMRVSNHLRYCTARAEHQTAQTERLEEKSSRAKWRVRRFRPQRSHLRGPRFHSDRLSRTSLFNKGTEAHTMACVHRRLRLGRAVLVNDMKLSGENLSRPLSDFLRYVNSFFGSVS